MTQHLSNQQSDSSTDSHVQVMDRSSQAADLVFIGRFSVV